MFGYQRKLSCWSLFLDLAEILQVLSIFNKTNIAFFKPLHEFRVINAFELGLQLPDEASCFLSQGMLRNSEVIDLKLEL